MSTTEESTSNVTIPVVDFSSFLHGTPEERNAVVAEIADACRTIGFFVVKGHGVDATVIDEAWNATTQFFDLPISEKSAYTSTDEATYPFGYSGMGMEVLSAGKDREGATAGAAAGAAAAPDLKELFSLGPSNPASGFPAPIYPTQPPQLKAALSAYYEACNALANQLLSAIALGLGLEEGHFAQYVDHHASALRVLNYPALPEGYEFKPGQLRASAHTDYGTITILRSGGPGLQVTKDRHPPVWSDVPSIAPPTGDPTGGVFIINLGDLMRRWTNDSYCSTLHRVLPCPDRRQSMAFFHNLNRDALVTNLRTEEEPKYPPILAGEFLMQKHLAALARSPTVVNAKEGEAKA